MRSAPSGDSRTLLGNQSERGPDGVYSIGFLGAGLKERICMATAKTAEKGQLMKESRQN